jgi:hypothetical protein
MRKATDLTEYLLVSEDDDLCPGTDSKSLQGYYSVTGTFTDPGAGWAVVDPSGFTNTLIIEAHLSGNLDTHNPPEYDEWLRITCPTRTRAWLADPVNVPVFDYTLGGPTGVGKILTDDDFGPYGGKARTHSITITQPDQIVDTSIGGALKCEVYRGAGSVLGSFNWCKAEYWLSGGLAEETTWVKYKENVPPTCNLTAVIPGPPMQIQITAQDTGSGLASIAAKNIINATLTFFPFTQGATSPVVLTATKIDQNLSAQVELQVSDVVGNITTCDPVIMLVVREKGEPESETVAGVPEAEHFVTIQNGDPGLKNLRVTVNGTQFQIAGLRDGEERTVDVASAMVEGGNNTFILTALGKPGTSATVVIHD